MKTPKKYLKYFEYIENNITECDVSYRGGIMKVDLSRLFSQKSNDAIIEAGESAIAGASQNYLGGGIAGAIKFGSMFNSDLLTKPDYKKMKDVAEALKMYFYNINNGGGDEYMQENVNTYKVNQSLPGSAY